MTIQEIYNLAIEMGTNADLRGKERVNKNLARLKEKYEKMDAEEKKEFDLERLKIKTEIEKDYGEQKIQQVG